MASMTTQSEHASSVDHVVGDRSRDTFLNEDASVQLGSVKICGDRPFSSTNPSE